MSDDMSDESPDEVREPTEDELIDFMSWLIDRELPTEEINMSQVEVTDEPLDRYNEDSLGPATGAEVEADFADKGGEPNCRWWEERLYVADMGEIRLVYSLI